MRKAVVLVPFVALAFVAPLGAQSAPASGRDTQAPVVASPPTPVPTRNVGSAPSVTYQSVKPQPSYRIEPVDGQHVRVGGWESSGFTVDIDRNVTRIASDGEARATTGRLRVDSVEIEFVDGRGYLTLANPQP